MQDRNTKADKLGFKVKSCNLLKMPEKCPRNLEIIRDDCIKKSIIYIKLLHRFCRSLDEKCQVKKRAHFTPIKDKMKSDLLAGRQTAAEAQTKQLISISESK